MKTHTSVDAAILFKSIIIDSLVQNLQICSLNYRPESTGSINQTAFHASTEFSYTPIYFSY